MTTPVGCLAALILPLLGAMALPAPAADALELSPDGVTWSGRVVESLFDPAVRWVPGDERRARFYVRHQADGVDNVSILLEAHDPDWLLPQQDLRMSARIGSASWVDLAPDPLGFRLADVDLAPGVAHPVDVRVRLDPATRGTAQQSAVGLDFKISLPGVDATSDVDVRRTGVSGLGWWILAGGAGVGAGLGLMKRRTRGGES